MTTTEQVVRGRHDDPLKDWGGNRIVLFKVGTREVQWAQTHKAWQPNYPGSKQEPSKLQLVEGYNVRVLHKG